MPATLIRDVRVAFRSLQGAPSFAFVAAATLALGIGASVAMFSVLNGVLLQDLRVRAQDEVVVAWTRAPARDADRLPVQHADVVGLRERTRTFSAIAGVAYQGAVEQVLRAASEPVTAAMTWVTGDFFPLLGVAPLHGRTLQPADDAPGAEPVVVLSHGFWQRLYAGDPLAVGRSLEWDGRTMTVVGVLPAGFSYPRGVDIWMPVLPAFPATLEVDAPPAEAMVFNVVGRLAPGVGRAAAAAEFASYLRETDAQRQAGMRELQPVVTPLVELVTGDVRHTVWTAAAAVALLLLMSCINVANLLLIRGSARIQELAVRTALGADRARLVGLMVTEAAVLAGGAGVAGVLLAHAAVQALVAVAPPELPRLDMVGVDGTALLFAVAATTVATLLAGVLPALLMAARDPGRQLGTTRGTVSQGGAQKVRHALVVGQIALAVVVVTSAGLLVRSLHALQAADMGFDGERLLVVDTALPAQLQLERPQLLDLRDEVVARVAALPTVVSAASLPRAPFSGERGWTAMYSGEGQTEEQQATNPWVNFEVVGAGYFETLGMPLLRGRGFTEQDRENALPVAVISEAVARVTWPDEDPIGRRLRLGSPDSHAEGHTVVGVVGETRYRDLVEPQPSLYLPVRQFAGPVPTSLAVRTYDDAASVLPQLRAVLQQVHPELMLAGGGSVQQLMAEPLARPRFAALLLGTFAIVTLLLAVVGIYGALAFATRQRTREIGVRIALGARAGQVGLLVLGQGLRLALAGALIGVAAAFAATRALQSLLFGVTPHDPITFVAVTGLILGGSAVACWLPARRASRVDPARTLRSDS